MFASIAGGAVLGAGIAAGIQTGTFGKVFQGAGNVASQGADMGINFAQTVMEGVKPFVGDAGLGVLQQGFFEVGPVQGMEVVSSYTNIVNDLGQEYVNWPFKANPGTGRADPVVVEDMFLGGGGSLLALRGKSCPESPQRNHY